MVRLTTFGVAVLGLVLTVAPARAQGADAAIEEAHGLVRRAGQPFRHPSEADRCAFDLGRALAAGREAIQALSGEERARAADALNLLTIRAALARLSATGGVDVRRDLLPLDEASGDLELGHLTGSQQELVQRLLKVLHGLSRLPRDAGLDASARADVERDLDACEADLRGMLHVPALTTYLRGLGYLHERLVRESRARTLTVRGAWPLTHASTIVDRAYVEARTPGVGPQPQARQVELRGLPSTTRGGEVLRCAARVDAPAGAPLVRVDVETIDAAGARVGLVREWGGSPAFDVVAPRQPGRYTVLVSALLEDDRVLHRTVALEVTDDVTPTTASIGLAGRLAGRGTNGE